MHDARTAFFNMKYMPEKGIQGYYDNLIDHMQNMAMYPDGYTIMEQFISGLPAYYRNKLFKEGLHMEINSIEEFVAVAKAKELTEKTIEQYNRKMGI